MNVLQVVRFALCRPLNRYFLLRVSFPAQRWCSDCCEKVHLFHHRQGPWSVEEWRCHWDEVESGHSRKADSHTSMWSQSLLMFIESMIKIMRKVLRWTFFYKICTNTWRYPWDQSEFNETQTLIPIDRRKVSLTYCQCAKYNVFVFERIKLSHNVISYTKHTMTTTHASWRVRWISMRNSDYRIVLKRKRERDVIDTFGQLNNFREIRDFRTVANQCEEFIDSITFNFENCPNTASYFLLQLDN